MTDLPFTLESFLTHDYRQWCLDNKETLVKIPMVNSNYEPIEMEIPGKELIFNIFLWKPLIRRKMPIVKEKFLFHDEDYTANVICRINTEIFMEVIKVCPETINQLKLEFIVGIEEANNFTISRLNNYTYMVDLPSIIETMTTEKSKEVTHVDVEHTFSHGVKVIEKACKEIQKRTTDYFSSKETTPNIFYPAVHLGTLNPIQFAQMVSCIGTRTDTDESMIHWPITHGFIEGLQNIGEYCLESLTAKKSEMYNAVEMATAQYTNRKFQLNASAVKRIYPGDCGTTVTIPFMITQSNYKHVFGKYFDDNGVVTLFNKDNAKNFIGKRINLYSPLTCRHTDGYCHKCGGLLAQYFLPSSGVPGIIAGSEVMSPLVQQILSNKHMATTFATLYHIPQEYTHVLVNRGNNLFFANRFPVESITIGVPYATCCKISDLKDLKGAVKEAEYFSKVTKLWLRYHDGEKIIEHEPQFTMEDENGTIPYLSRECLEYIKKNPQMVHTEDPIIWIKMEKFPKSHPFMTARIFNYSTKFFVQKIQEVLTKDIKYLHSCTELLEKLSTLIWNRTSPNLLHIEAICKSFLISDNSMDIPVVEDPDNVKFAKLEVLIPNRSIGTQIGFEKFVNFLSKPSVFLYPRTQGPFDNLVGLEDEDRL